MVTLGDSGRKADHPIIPLFLDRWSPRAFDGSEMTDADLLTLFEAARWAPSSFNYQPWRFLYARRQDPHWTRFLDLLVPSNQAWAANAAVLIFMLSERQMRIKGENYPSHSHSFDCGAAWMALALQATQNGYRAHAMTGVDFDRAQVDLRVSDDFRIEAAIAIGRQAPAESLPEKLRLREVPSDRRPVEQSLFLGELPVAP